MRIGWIGVGVLGVAAAITSCEDDRVVDEGSAPAEVAGTECNAYFDCACPNLTWGTEDECRTSRQAGHESEYEAAQAAGLTFDGACVGQQLDAIDSLGCAPRNPDDADGDCRGFCRAYHGDVAEGGACTIVSGTGFSDCSQGLQCSNAVCSDPCGRGQGEVCFENGNQQPCAPDLLCDVERTNTCVAIPGDGDPCVQGVCAEDLICSDTGTCTRGLADGQPCQAGTECASRFCNEGTCFAAPGKGDACAGICAEGLFCVEATCREAAQEGQSCANVPCAEPLICGQAGVCEQRPPAVCG